MRSVFLLLCFLCVLPLLAQAPVSPRDTPPQFMPFEQTETHRIRIINAADGAVQVSQDTGRTWRLVGRVTAPATQSLMGYLASGYAPISTIAATAVHGIRIRVGDLSHAYPSLINILPREFAQTPKRFGGHIAGASGVYTNIPTGTAIFRELAPLVGNPVYLEDGQGRLSSLPVNYIPRENDVYVIVVRQPVNPLREVVFENRAGGQVRVTFADGTQRVLTSVIKPVSGVGRFDGTSYTGVGAINTNHCGVITVSTAPVSTSPQLEGEGPERRGGFQIMPIYHNSQSEEAGAPQVLSVGVPEKKRVPDQEGMPPLFSGYLGLTWNPADTAHSWRVQVQTKGGPDWQPMPVLTGDSIDALRSVTAIRLIRTVAGDDKWRTVQIAAAAQAYTQAQITQARTGRIPIARGRMLVHAQIQDPRARYVAFYVDGDFRGLTNSSPFNFTWDTTANADGEYVVEARAEDGNSAPISTTRTKFWVDNARQVAAR